MNIEKIKLMVQNGEKVETGKKDVNGKQIYLGDHLVNVNYSPLTYEVRIRKNMFVLHTGGSYSELTEVNALKCEINQNVTLGHGHDLFKGELIL